MRPYDYEIYLEIRLKRMYAVESSFTIPCCQGETYIYAVIASSSITLISSTKTSKSKIRFWSLLACVCEHKGDQTGKGIRKDIAKHQHRVAQL